ncbi:UNVERIFIED_CONTAM: protein phosphatase 2C domain-containing protein [Hammondia hammondi]|eukprot:XP_008885653.1 protein phosphatase 2C domain-containing protein [Hammondia hammondi]
MTFGSALAELPVCVGSAPRGSPSPACPLPTSSLSALQRKRTLPAPSSFPRGYTSAHGSTHPAVRGRTPAEESVDFFLEPRNRLRESLERDLVERRKGSTETLRERCVTSETHDDIRVGRSALPQPRLAPLFVPGMVPDGPAAAVLPCTPHRHAVIRCTRGPFEGRFFFVNKGQKGDIFGGGKDRREVTMYVEHAGLSVTHAQVVEETGDGDRRREDSLALLDLNSDTGTWARVRWDRPTPLCSLSGSAASRSSCPLKNQCGFTGGRLADVSSRSSLPCGSSPSSGPFSPFPSVAYSSPACKQSTGVSKRQSAEQGACLPASPMAEVCGPSQFLLFQGTLLRLCRGAPLSPWEAFFEFLKAFELSHLWDIIIRALQQQCRCSLEHPKREQVPPVSPRSYSAAPYGSGSAFLGRPWSLQSDQGRDFLATPESENPSSSSVVLSGRPEAAPRVSPPGRGEENATDSDLGSVSSSVSGPLSTFRTQGGLCPLCMRNPLDRLAEASPSCLFASLQSLSRGKETICREGSGQSAGVESAAASSTPLSSFPFSIPVSPFASHLSSARASAPSLPTPSLPSLHADPVHASSSVLRSLSTVGSRKEGAVGGVGERYLASHRFACRENFLSATSHAIKRDCEETRAEETEREGRRNDQGTIGECGDSLEKRKDCSKDHGFASLRKKEKPASGKGDCYASPAACAPSSGACPLGFSSFRQQRTPEEGKARNEEQARDGELTYEDLLKWKLACKNLPHYLPVEVKSRPLLVVDHASGTLLGQVSWTGACLFPAFRSDSPVVSSSACMSSSSGASESFLSRPTTSCPASRCSSASSYAAFFLSPSQVGTKADHTDEVAAHMPLDRPRESQAAAPGAHGCGKQTPRFSLQASPSKRHSCSGKSDAFDPFYAVSCLSSGKKTHREKREDSDDGRQRADRNDRRSVEAANMKGDSCATTETRETETGRDGRGHHVSQTSEKPNVQETRALSVPLDKRKTASARGEDRASEAKGFLLQRDAESSGEHAETQETKACEMSSVRRCLSPLLTHSEDRHHFGEAASLHALSPEKKGQRSADLDALKPESDRAFLARKNLHLAISRDSGGGEGGAEKEEKEKTREQHRRVPEEEGRGFEEGNISGHTGMVSGIEKMPVVITHSEGRATLPDSLSDLPSSSSLSSFSAFSYSSVASGQSPTCRSPCPQLSPERWPRVDLSVVDKDLLGGSILLSADSLSLPTSPAVARQTPAASLPRAVLRAPVVASTCDAGTSLSASSAFVSSSPCSALSSFSSEVAPVSLRSPTLTPPPKSLPSALGRCRPHSLSANEERETRAFLLPFPSIEERRTDQGEEGKPLSPALNLRASKTPLQPQKRGDGVETEDAKREDETERGNGEASRGGEGGEREGHTQRYGEEESERVKKEQRVAGKETREGFSDKGQGRRTEDTGADADRGRRSGAKEDEESTARGRMRSEEGKLGTPDRVRKRQRRTVSVLQKHLFLRNGNASYCLSLADWSEANKVHLDAPPSLRKRIISGHSGFLVSSPSSLPAGQERVREGRGSSVCTRSSSPAPVFQSSVSTSSSPLGSNGQSASSFVLPVTRSSPPSFPLSFGVRQARTPRAKRAARTQTESKSFGLQSAPTPVCSLQCRSRDEARGGDIEQEAVMMETLATGAGRETERSRTLMLKETEEEAVFSGIVKRPEACMCNSVVAPSAGQPREADEKAEEEDTPNERSGRKDGDAREACQEEQGERQMVHTPWHGSPPASLMLERRSRSETDSKNRESGGERPVAQLPWVSSSSAVSRCSSAASPLSLASFETVRGPTREGQQGTREKRQVQREKTGDLRSGWKEGFDREMMQRGGLGTTTTEVACDRRRGLEGSQKCPVSSKPFGGDTVFSSSEALTPSSIPFVSSEPHRALSPASSVALRLGALRSVLAASWPHSAPASQLCPEPLGSEREKAGDGWGREEKRVPARPDRKRDEGDEEEAEVVGEGQTQEGTEVDRKRGGDAEAKNDEGDVIARGKRCALRRDEESTEIHSCRLASLGTDNTDVVDFEDRNRFSSVCQKTFSRQRKAGLSSICRFVSSPFSALPPECPASLHASPSALPTPPRRTVFPRFLVSPGVLGKCGSSPVSSSSSARRASAENSKKEKRRLFPFLYDKRGKKTRRKRAWRRDDHCEEKEEENEENHDKKEGREEKNGDQEEKKEETEKVSEQEAETGPREQRGREELQGLQESERYQQKREEANGEKKRCEGEEVVKHEKTRNVVETSGGAVGLAEVKASAKLSLLEAEALQKEQGRYEEATVECAGRLSRNENQQEWKVKGRRLVTEDEEEGIVPSEVVLFDLCEGDNRDSNAGAPPRRELRAGCLASVPPSSSACLPTPSFPPPFSPRASSPPPLLLSGLAGGSGGDLGEQTSLDGDAQRGDCRLPRLQESACTRLRRLRNENICEREPEEGEGIEDEKRGEKSGRREEEQEAERALREKGTRKEGETHVVGVKGDEASSGAPGVLLPILEALWFDADVAEERRGGGDTEETFLGPRFPPTEVVESKQRMHAEVAPLKESGPSSALRAPECEGNDVASLGASLSLFSPVASSVAVWSFSASSLHCMRSSSCDVQPNGQSERRRGAGRRDKGREEMKPGFCAFSRFPLSRFLVNAERNERQLSAQEEKQECETDEGRDEAEGGDGAPEGSIACASLSDAEFLCPDSVGVRVPAFQVSRRRIADKGQGDGEGQGAERKEESDGAGGREATTRQRGEVEDVDARSRGDDEVADQEKRHLGKERREEEGHDSKKGKESDTGERVAGGVDMEGLQKGQEERTLSTETREEERHRLPEGLAPVLLSSLLSHLVASRRQIFQELRIFCSSPPAALPPVLTSPSSRRRAVSVPASSSPPVSFSPRLFLASGLSSPSPPSPSSRLPLSSFSSLSDSSSRNSSSFRLGSAAPSRVFRVHGNGEPERPREVREPTSQTGDEKKQKSTSEEGEAETVTEKTGEKFRTSPSCFEALPKSDDATGSVLGGGGAPVKPRFSLDACCIAADRFDSKPGVAGERSRLSSSTLCSNPKQEPASVCMWSNGDSSPSAEAQGKFETDQKRPVPGNSLPDRSTSCVSYGVSAYTRESPGTSIQYVETRSDSGHHLKVNEGTLCIPKNEDERVNSDVGDGASPFPLSVSERQTVASDPQSSLHIDSSSVHTALPAILPKTFCSATFRALCSASGLRKPIQRLGKSSRSAGDGRPRSAVPDCALSTPFGATGSADNETRHPEGDNGRSSKLSRSNSPSARSPHGLRKVDGDTRPPAAIRRDANSDYWSLFKKKRSVEGDSSASATSLAATSHGNQTQKLPSCELQKKPRSGDHSPAGPGGAPGVDRALAPSTTAVVKGKSRAPGTEWNPVARQARDKAQKRSDDLTSFLFGEEDDEVVLHKTKQYLLRHPREDRPVIFVPVSASGVTSPRSPFCPASPVGPPAGLSDLPADSRPYPFLSSFSPASPALDPCQVRHDAGEDRRASLLATPREELSEVETSVWRMASLAAQTRLAPSPLLSPVSTSSFSPFFSPSSSPSFSPSPRFLSHPTSFSSFRSGSAFSPSVCPSPPFALSSSPSASIPPPAFESPDCSSPGSSAPSPRFSRSSPACLGTSPSTFHGILVLFLEGTFQLVSTARGLQERQAESFVSLPPATPLSLRPDAAFRLGNLDLAFLRFNVGCRSERGLRPTMEDEEVIIQDLGISDAFSCSFFGVYDGHGGRDCAQFVKQHLHQAFHQQLEQLCGRLDFSQRINFHIFRALYFAFLLTDAAYLRQQRSGSLVSQTPDSLACRGSLGSSPREVTGVTRVSGAVAGPRKKIMNALVSEGSPVHAPGASVVPRESPKTHPFLSPRARPRPSSSGCASVVVVVVGGAVWCANCGDARAVLARNGRAVDLSSDHKPDRKDEVKRIVQAGGFIRCRRVLGRLAVSRAFGDLEYKGSLYEEEEDEPAEAREQAREQGDTCQTKRVGKRISLFGYCEKGERERECERKLRGGAAFQRSGEPAEEDGPVFFQEAGKRIYLGRKHDHVEFFFASPTVQSSLLFQSAESTRRSEPKALSGKREKKIYREPLVIAAPEIRRIALTPSDEFLLLACDGLFDVFSSDEAVAFIRRRLSAMPPYEQDPQQVVTELVREAIHERRSRDNVTAILVVFSPYVGRGGP